MDKKPTYEQLELTLKQLTDGYQQTLKTLGDTNKELERYKKFVKDYIEKGQKLLNSTDDQVEAKDTNVFLKNKKGI